MYVRLRNTQALVSDETDSRVTKKQNIYMTVLLHFDRDLFGHTLCASCQSSSTAAI